MNIVVGQRWVSHTEPNLGLGIIIEITGRLIGVSFPAANDTRTYAKDNAPLSRIRYAIGDTVTNMDDESFIVSSVNEHSGLIRYQVHDADFNTFELQELELNCFVQFTTPRQRLISGQFGGNSAFNLRVETLNHINRLQQSTIAGLQGARVDLLPHQIYIANEVSKRHAPRVLLADEVGLGKTIEAGMILHQQLHTGRAQRVLILVPESLVHQWLVEMLRRFNLRFSIFDQARISAIESVVYEFDEDDEDYEQLIQEFPQNQNPFDTEQQILCSLDLLTKNPKIHKRALEAEWDLIIVDEAHHLHWSEQGSSPEYDCVEQLTQTANGLLLLTATPEQAGIEGHFARLRLLDPDRFYDLEKFKQEESGFQKLNGLVEKIQSLIDLLQNPQNNSEILAEKTASDLISDLTTQLPESLATNIEDQWQDIDALKQLLNQLVDRHGTGRALFRNTRATIKGFPIRELQAYALPCPELYLNADGHSNDKNASSELIIQDKLHPEKLFPESDWIQLDPRVNWLVEKLKSLKPLKVLVICHHASTAIALDKHLNLKAGIRSTSFYPGLSIIERDRAAAYFSDPDGGAQVLICSEIGSEGRNFQFSHHLVLFDLPLNPDLIEQRIGRLDRIGQRQNIQIHVPYFENTAQSIIFNWYHQGLNLFEKSCSAGYAIYEKYSDALHPLLANSEGDETALIEETSAYAQNLSEQMQQGRDRLLELNSCRPEIAKQLIENIQQEEQSTLLSEYMTRLFDEMGVEHEFHSEHTLVIKPGNHMQTDYFPGLKGEGNTITFDRAKALSREDIEFLNWEHPMVVESMEMIQTEETGKAAVATISVKGLPPATLLLECFYTVETMSPKDLQLARYLPLHPFRSLFDINGKNLDSAVPHKNLNALCSKLPKRISRTVVEQVKEQIETMLDYAQKSAEATLPAIKAQANQKMKKDLSQELNRLKSLKSFNPMIRDEEITFLEKMISVSSDYIEKAGLHMQAIRLVINNPK